MAEDSNLAIAALVVALVALFTAISQVLSQLFATADGYRRCQSSIIGPWAKLTTRKFRWRELRYETIYTTPRFSLAPYYGSRSWQGKPDESVMSMAIRGTPTLPLDGTQEMIEKTYATPPGGHGGLEVYNGPSEMVSWVRLIDALHVNADYMRRSLVYRQRSGFNYAQEDWGGYTIPMIKRQKHSWDFVPPDVVRPLAVMTLQDLAVFARRLGMEWKTFEPSKGTLIADGNDFTADSTSVRSVGIVAQISTPEPLKRYGAKNRLFIPTEPVDKMGFGIITGDRALHIGSYDIGTPAECLARARQIDVGAAEELSMFVDDGNGWTPGFSDIISLASPMLRLRGSTIIQVPRPAQYEGGFTWQLDGFVVFSSRLRELIKDREAKLEEVSEQLRWVLHQYDDLKSRYGGYWEDHDMHRGNETPLEFLEDLHDRHNATTQYFRNLQSNIDLEEKDATNGRPRLRYLDLMNAHIKEAIYYVSRARESIDEGRARDQYGLQVGDWIIEGAHIYFDNVGKIAESLGKRRPISRTLVEDAWMTMMLRAFLWQRSHLMIDGNRVPSQYWGSRQPVYIG